MSIAIIDYGMGNLHSVAGALHALGSNCSIASSPDQIQSATHIILPGVGGFSECVANLDAGGWREPLRTAALCHGKPFLGICVGMQMLADFGEEGGQTPGLGLIPGKVTHLDTQGCTLRIPHVGWNSLYITASDEPIVEGIPSSTDFYFVHSYAFEAANPDQQLAHAEYGVPLCAMVGAGKIFGTQFHPEKSSRAGARLLQNFVSLM